MSTILNNKKLLEDFNAHEGVRYRGESNIKIYSIVSKENNEYKNSFIFEMDNPDFFNYEISFNTTDLVNESFIIEFAKFLKHFYGKNEEERSTVNSNGIQFLIKMSIIKITNSHKINKYFEQYKDDYVFTKEDIVRFCALNNKLSWDEIYTFTKKYLKKYNINIHKIEKYMFPELLELDSEQYYNGLRFYVRSEEVLKQNATVKDCVLLDDIQTFFLQFDKLKKSEKKEHNLDILFKDFTVDPYFSGGLTDTANKAVEFLFLQKDFNNIINSISLKDLYKLLSLHYYDDQDILNDEIFKKARDDKNVFSFESLNKTYFNLINKTITDDINKKYYVDFYNYMNDKSIYYYPILFVIEKHFDEIETISKDDVVFLVDEFLKKPYDKQIVPMIIIDRLLNITATSKIIDLFKEVNNYKEKINIQQWLNYIDHYEEYKELPVSWWTELV